MWARAGFAILFTLIACAASVAQRSDTDPGPLTQAQCKFSDDESITVNYRSPRMAGRKIFGGLVPYGKVWRTGANEATTFVTDDDLVTLKGTNIPPGSYGILVIPTPEKWTLIIKKNTVYESAELVRVPMSVRKLASPVESFTISFDNTGGSCIMHMSWENTRASLEFARRNTDLPLRGTGSARLKK